MEVLQSLFLKYIYLVLKIRYTWYADFGVMDLSVYEFLKVGAGRSRRFVVRKPTLLNGSIVSSTYGVCLHRVDFYIYT